jgi:opacity protein-like surface antigen
MARSVGLFGGVLITLLSWSCPIVWAQEDVPSHRVDPYVALFGGVALPSRTDTTVESGAFNQHFTVFDQNFASSRSLGGKIGVWIPAFRRSVGLDYGLELDVTNYQPDVKAGQFRGSGTASGTPVAGASLSRSLNVNSTIVAGNLLLRLPLYASEAFPNGRLYPYLGGGPGFQNSTFTGGRANSDFAVQAVAGLHIFLAKRLSLFGEYKYTHVSQTFGLGNQDTTFTFNVSHLVGGLAFHFGR